MELREYLAILKKGSLLWAVIVIIALAGAFLWQKNQAPRYEANLLLNIGRQGNQETQDYTYDGFYRLQADERFADTVVRWLGDPRVKQDIMAEAVQAPSAMSKAFEAKRLSSQVIEVTYSSSDASLLPPVGEAAARVLNRYAASLNTDDAPPAWFRIIGTDPVIRDARIPLLPALLVGLAIGLFFGFWIVLFKHYLSGK